MTGLVNHPQNNIYCVGWEVKPPTHYFKVIFNNCDFSGLASKCACTSSTGFSVCQRCSTRYSYSSCTPVQIFSTHTRTHAQCTRTRLQCTRTRTCTHLFSTYYFLIAFIKYIPQHLVCYDYRGSCVYLILFGFSLMSSSMIFNVSSRLSYFKEKRMISI